MSSQNIRKTIGANDLQIYYNSKWKNEVELTCYAKDVPNCIEGSVTLDVDGVKELHAALDNFLKLIEFDERLAQDQKDGKR